MNIDESGNPNGETVRQFVEHNKHMKHEKVYGEKEVHKMMAEVTVEAFKSGFDQGYKLATDEALRLVRNAFPDELDATEASVG